MKKLHTKQWFLDRISKRVFRDDSKCGCSTCNDIIENGTVISDEQHAEYLYELQCGYANEGVYLNYRDELSTGVLDKETGRSMIGISEEQNN